MCVVGGGGGRIFDQHWKFEPTTGMKYRYQIFLKNECNRHLAEGATRTENQGLRRHI